MDARAPDGDSVLAGVYRDEFVGRHREAQTARSASAAQTSNYTASARTGQTECLRLFDQADLPHATFDFQANRSGSFAVGLVRVFVVFVAQSVRVAADDTPAPRTNNATFLD